MQVYNKISAISYLLCSLTLWGCQGQPVIEDITKAPRVKPVDKKYAGIFKALDGTWRGEFGVYVDQRGQVKDKAQPKDIDEAFFRTLPLKLENVIHVQQHYFSESPYFQRLTIEDTYASKNGQPRVVRSRGVNKIQDGKMWCVVVKPDETVVHSGREEGPETIVWQRSLKEPVKIEYFKETVHREEYTILGWGYYGDDAPDLSPRHWFFGKYKKVN
ncbi:MAG: hypothetical protein ACE5HO_13110 [bacterium]